MQNEKSKFQTKLKWKHAERANRESAYSRDLVSLVSRVQPGTQTHISSGRKRWMMAHRARPLRQDVVRSVILTCW
jgi:hypothetical protein